MKIMIPFFRYHNLKNYLSFFLTSISPHFVRMSLSYSPFLNDDFHNERSYNNISLDVLKSGLQKYIRRADFDKAIWCAVELDLFFCCLTRGEIIRTNFIHRLMVIYLEDIGPCGIGMWKRISELVFFLFEVRKLREGNFEKTRKEEMRIITEIIYLLSNSQHSRTYDHIFNFINIGKVRKLSDFAKRYYPDIYIRYNKIAGIPAFILKLDENKKEIQKEVDEIIYWLEQKDILVYSSINNLIRKIGDMKINLYYYRKRRVEYFIFYILEQYTKLHDKIYPHFSELLKIALKWMPEIRKDESFYIVYQLTYYVLYPESYKEINLIENYQDLSYEVYSRNVLGDKINIDSFVIDMNTYSGKKMGRSIVEFIHEGSRVENEWPDIDKRLKDFYQDSKVSI